MPVIVWRRVIASTLVLTLMTVTHGAGIGFWANAVISAICAVVLLASIPAPWVKPQRRDLLPKEVEEEFVAADRRFDQHCLFGTHNSTHQCSIFGWLLVASWRFTHASLPEQLEDGIRTIELDIWYNIDSGDWEVRHENLIDCLTTAGTPDSFSETLSKIQTWSKGNRDHFPLVINLDIKGSFKDGLGWAAPLIGRGLHNNCRHSTTAYGKLQKVIQEVFPDEFLYRPQDLKNRHGVPEMPLRACVQEHGWPVVPEMKGRSIFLLNLYGKISRSAGKCDSSFFFVRGHDFQEDIDSVYFECEVNASQQNNCMWRSLTLSTATKQPSMYALDDLSAVACSIAPVGIGPSGDDIV